MLRVDAAARELVVYRRGGVTTQEALAALERAGIAGYTARIVAKSGAPGVALAPATAAAPADAAAVAAGDARAGGPVGDVAPGQLLTHYAPDVETRLVARVVGGAVPAGAAIVRASVDAAVVVDFRGALACLSPRALAYRDLSARCACRAYMALAPRECWGLWDTSGVSGGGGAVAPLRRRERRCLRR